jgi:hypothetical protein
MELEPINQTLQDIYKNRLGFELPKKLKDIEYFHHAGPWLFKKLNDIYGLGGITGYADGLVFRCGAKSLRNVWFSMEHTGDPFLMTNIKVLTSEAEHYNGTGDEELYMQIVIGYGYGEENPTEYATETNNIVLEKISRSIVINGPLFITRENKDGDNPDFKHEFFCAEVIEKVILRFCEIVFYKFDAKEIQLFKNQMTHKAKLSI